MHGSHLDKRHGYRVEVGARSDWLWFVDFRGVLELVLYFRMSHGIVHGRKRKKGRRVCVVVDCWPLLWLLVVALLLTLGVDWDHFIAARATHCTGGTSFGFQAWDFADAVVGDVIIPSNFCWRYEGSSKAGIPFGCCCSGSEPLGSEDCRCEKGRRSGVARGGIDSRSNVIERACAPLTSGICIQRLQGVCSSSQQYFLHRCTNQTSQKYSLCSQ